MKRQFKINVNGTDYEIELDDTGASPMAVLVNGKEYQVTVEGATRTPVTTPVATPVAPVVVSAAPATAPARAPQAPATTGSGNDIRSPMPGVIHDVVVKAGDKVIAGQQICALEAMKMKSAVRAPREATIASVEVTNGQKVAYGDVIVRFA